MKSRPILVCGANLDHKFSQIERSLKGGCKGKLYRPVGKWGTVVLPTILVKIFYGRTDQHKKTKYSGR